MKYRVQDIAAVTALSAVYLSLLRRLQWEFENDDEALALLALLAMFAGGAICLVVVRRLKFVSEGPILKAIPASPSWIPHIAVAACCSYVCVKLLPSTPDGDFLVLALLLSCLSWHLLRFFATGVWFYERCLAVNGYKYPVESCRSRVTRKEGRCWLMVRTPYYATNTTIEIPCERVDEVRAFLAEKQGPEKPTTDG